LKFLPHIIPVIPAKDGIQLKMNNPRSGQNLIVRLRRNCLTNWIPAFAGMTAGAPITANLEHK
jgi:hypothetical protein